MALIGSRRQTFVSYRLQEESANGACSPDFGIAKWIDDDESRHTLTAEGMGIGTPEYMAPEQGMGKKIDFNPQSADAMYGRPVILIKLND